MRYFYQKDEGALPGNLQNRKYSFLFTPPPKCSVSHCLYTFFFLLSLSGVELSLVEGSAVEC
jgi:hypothetical protein